MWDHLARVIFFPADAGTVTLKNTANNDVEMPLAGLGTGCFESCPPPTDMVAYNMSLSFLEMGGRRIDAADSYGCEPGIGKAIRDSKIPRKDIFIESKIGPGGLAWPLGYNETLSQAREILQNYSTTYVDLLLIHWPTNYGPCSYHGPKPSIPTTDPLCDTALSSYNETGCRLSTWRAMIQVWKSGLARAIGVSNFNTTHLKEIAAAGLPLPSVNQCSFSPHHGPDHKGCTPYTTEESCGELLQYCKDNNIVYNGYSPFGGRGGAGSLLKDSRLVAMATHHNAVPSQVVLNWQWQLGMPTNPQATNPLYQAENLNFTFFRLNASEMNTLNHFDRTPRASSPLLDRPPVEATHAIPNPSLGGPYSVGTRVIAGTVTERNLSVSVWYPSTTRGDETPVVYDLRDHLPDNMAAKLRGSLYELGCPHWCSMYPENPQCYANLAVASETVGEAPDLFPLIVFVHGTGGWSGQSLQLVAHWASRGFVVVAADYPGITLKDMLLETEFKRVPPIDQVGDTRRLLTAIRSAADKGGDDPQWGWLLPRVNVSNNALIGHSAGAFAVGELHDEARVVIPMAGKGVVPSAAPVSTLVLCAVNDTVVPARSNAIPGYATTHRPKRLAEVTALGHHFCSDICAIGAAKGGIEAIAAAHGIWQANLFGFLATDGCEFENKKFDNPVNGWRFVNYMTSAVLELTLLGDADMLDALEHASDVLEDIAQYKEDV
eukprot:m.592665 g.592665  ORF g.592665 m.592665 type:complete len:717 (-) comp22391_c0_seq19:490-2640(-)